MKGYSVAVGVNIDEIDRELLPARRMRVNLSDEAIAEYSAIIDRMPPVKLVVDDAGHHWVADGAHTITAAKKAGRKDVQAIVRRGTFHDAWREAARANDTHGVRITNADKRHRVEVALADAEMKTWSNRRIAEWCGVSPQTVCNVRPEPTVQNGQLPSDPPKTIGRDGKARKAPVPRQPRKVIPYAEGDPRSARAATEPEPEPTRPREEPRPPWAVNGDAQPTRESVGEMFGHPHAPAPTTDASGAAAPAEFDHESAWGQVEALILEHFASWPDDYKVLFKENFDSLGWRIGDMTPGWKPPVVVEVDDV